MGLALSALLSLLFFFLACQRFFITTGRVHTLDKVVLRKAKKQTVGSIQ
jgi:hypothetical protein